MRALSFRGLELKVAFAAADCIVCLAQEQVQIYCFSISGLRHATLRILRQGFLHVLKSETRCFDTAVRIRLSDAVGDYRLPRASQD